MTITTTFSDLVTQARTRQEERDAEAAQRAYAAQHEHRARLCRECAAQFVETFGRNAIAELGLYTTTTMPPRFGRETASLAFVPEHEPFKRVTHILIDDPGRAIEQWVVIVHDDTGAPLFFKPVVKTAGVLDAQDAESIAARFDALVLVLAEAVAYAGFYPPSTEQTR